MVQARILRQSCPGTPEHHQGQARLPRRLRRTSLPLEGFQENSARPDQNTIPLLRRSPPPQKASGRLFLCQPSPTRSRSAKRKKDSWDAADALVESVISSAHWRNHRGQANSHRLSHCPSSVQTSCQPLRAYSSGMLFDNASQRPNRFARCARTSALPKRCTGGKGKGCSQDRPYSHLQASTPLQIMPLQHPDCLRSEPRRLSRDALLSPIRKAPMSLASHRVTMIFLLSLLLSEQDLRHCCEAICTDKAPPIRPKL
mmetsp:Transcript_31725/g.50931  ORF Transcript_31725/g.50931 Transcript_31725/m.50931 type:complete len:257 (+) Transcript_31725:272-1042(+)